MVVEKYSPGLKLRGVRRGRQLTRAVRGVAMFGGVEILEPRVLLTSVAFQPATNYAMGFSPHFVKSADLNGDGKVDLVVTDYDNKKISVMINNGDGTFAPKVNYDTGTSPSGVAVADFNNDGKMDLAVSNFGSISLSVFFNNGNGTFQPKVDYGTGSGPSAISAGDFNNDSKMDLVVSNWYTHSVSVLINNGSGTFAPKVDFNVGTAPTAVMVADFDGNGTMDLAIPNWSSNTISVLMNGGNAAFAAKVDYQTGLHPNSGVAVDFNNDGKADIALPNESSDSMSVYINNGNGTFAPRVDYATAGFNPFGAASGDFNNDGVPDMAISNYYNGTVSIFTNNGNGTFVNQSDYAQNLTGITLGAGGAYNTTVEFITGGGAFYLTSADFNGDNKADLAVTNWVGDTVSILKNGSAFADAGFEYSIHVTAGTVNFATDQGAGGRSVNVEVADGATVNFNSSQTLQALTLGTNSNAVLAAGGNKMLIVNALSLDGANNNWASKLDLNDNDMIFNYGLDTTPFVTIKNQIKNGNTSGQTKGIVSTTSLTTASTTLAAVDNAIMQLTSFGGVTLDGTTHQIVFKFTYYGDANLDGKVTGTDYTFVDSNLGKSGPTIQWCQGDFNGDSSITGADYTFIDSNLFKGVAAPLATLDDTAPTGAGISAAVGRVRATGSGAVIPILKELAIAEDVAVKSAAVVSPDAMASDVHTSAQLVPATVQQRRKVRQWHFRVR